MRARAERDDACRDARLDDERDDLAAVVADRRRLAPREAAERERPGGPGDHGRGQLTDRHRRERRGDAERGTDDDRDEPDAHRHGEEPAAEVVAAAEEQRARADVLGRREERQRGGRRHRRREPVRVEERVGEGRQHEQDERRERPAEKLQLERPPEQPVQPPPVAGRDVAEAELGEALLDREVEERLRQADDGHDRREAAEVLEAEDPRGRDRAEDAEGDREIEPGCGRDTAPEDARGHRGGSV